MLDLGDGPYTAEEMRAWSGDRTVRASVIRELLLSNRLPVDPKGIRLRGVRIWGNLDLQAGTTRCPLSLYHCYCDTQIPLDLSGATAMSISFTDCLLPGLEGRQLRVQNLELGGSTLSGALRLEDATIAGVLNCQATRLAAPDTQYALNADRLRSGAVLLSGGFCADGPVSMVGATISGALSCSGARLSRADDAGYAFWADRIQLSENAQFDRGFAADGAVSLRNAEIGGRLLARQCDLRGRDYQGCSLVLDGTRVGDVYLQDMRAGGSIRLVGAVVKGILVCEGARMQSPDRSRSALVADKIRVSGDVYLDRLRAAGTVRFPGAAIEGSLSCSEAQVGASNVSLVADKATIAADLFLDDGFTVGGAISLISARIGDSLRIAGATLADIGVALNATGLRVGGALQWAPTKAVDGEVNLEGAEVGQLEDDWSGDRGTANGFWPRDELLRLKGFTYAAIGGPHPATVPERLSWIRSQYGEDRSVPYSIQPYDQLAAAYRAVGQDADERAVAIARRRDLRVYGDLSASRWIANWLFDKTVRYGYQNWRAAFAMVVGYLSVVLTSVVAQHLNLVEPVGSIAGLHPVPSAMHCIANYPCFYPAGYAFDVVFPLVNVHQAEFWGINGAAPGGWALITITWIMTALGWVGATFLVAGLTSLAGRR
ncbi:MAG TPA: hypothetical protein VMF87_05725 [Streptosporangiaceae bacterium]|nr:hypothetical protein [Streptosporangiaceae bacterium]